MAARAWVAQRSSARRCSVNRGGGGTPTPRPNAPTRRSISVGAGSVVSDRPRERLVRPKLRLCIKRGHREGGDNNAPRPCNQPVRWSHEWPAPQKRSHSKTLRKEKRLT